VPHSAPSHSPAVVLSDIARAFLASGTLPLSRSITRVQTVLKSADYNAADLAEHMRTDPTLTARVMSVANSSFFSQAPCDGISDAVNRLGSTQLMRIFSQVLARAVMMSPLRAYALSAEDIWRRAVIAAVGAELAAGRQRQDRSLAYMVGLLHELGMLVVNTHWARGPGARTLKLADFETEYSADEKRSFHFNQAEVGGEVLHQLAFPESVYRGVARQYKLPLEPLGRALYMGRMAKAVYCCGLTPNANLEIVDSFGLGTKRDMDAFMEDVHSEALIRIQGNRSAARSSDRWK